MTGYKVLVCGAGPGGCALALRLVQLGVSPADIALVDRRQLVGEQLLPAKICGDGLGQDGVDTLVSLGIPAERFARFQSISGLRIAAPSGVVIHAKNIPGKAGKVIPRVDLDGMLAAQVRRMGITLLDGREVQRVAVERDGCSIKLDGGETLTGQVLVGAGGASCKVARLLDANSGYEPKPREMYVAIRSYADNVDLGTPEIWMNFLSGMPGYAWAFPENGRANIGAGTTSYHLRQYATKKGVSATEALRGLLFDYREYLIQQGCAKSIEFEDIQSWPIPIGPRFRPAVDDRVLVVGDATGGAASPLTGGGIANTVTSALLAAQVVADACERGDYGRGTLASYQDMLRERLGPSLRHDLVVERVLENEFLFNIVAALLSRWPGLLNVIVG